MTQLTSTAATLHVAGADLRYTTTGTGPAVLMIQGVGVAGSGWDPQVETLARRFQIVTFDNRGIGGSTAGGDPLTIEAMAGDAIAILDTLGISRAHLMGHSMGGVIALHDALTAPARVQSLSLLCTGASGRQLASVSPGMLLTAIRTRLGTRHARRRAMMDLIMPDSYLRTIDCTSMGEELGRLFGHDLADQPPISMKQLRAMSRYSAEARLADLPRVPTLVISGAHDRIARPAYGRALAAGIADARYVEFADAGHALPIQCAARTNELLLQFLTPNSELRTPNSENRAARTTG